MQVPVKITGNSVGVRAGGNLVVNYRKLPVRALPANLPDVIEVDITELNIGNKKVMGKLPQENYKILQPDNIVVAYVKASRNSAKMAAAAEGKK
jgi:large subunit ribosomal protein L25